MHKGVTDVFMAAAPAAPTAGESFAATVLPFVVMLVVFYFLLWRPQQIQQKKRREMLNSIKRGDHVITVGGIHGEVTAVRDDIITLKIADNVEVRVSRSGIGQIKGKTF